MKKLFPLKQVMGFIFSLVLTAVAMCVYFLDMSFSVGMTILLITAFIQAGVQLVVFMHSGETGERSNIYMTIYSGVFLAIITILGTLLTMVWDM